MPTDDMVVVGRIGAPYGIKGWLHVQSFTDPADNLLTYSPWYWRADKGSEWQLIEPLTCRAHKKAFVAQIAGIDDRDIAAQLSGCMLAIRSETLPTVEGEYYWRDIVGCAVEDTHGTAIGRVVALTETGAHDVLVIKAENKTEFMIPFTAPYIAAVDIANKQIIADWLLEWNE